MRVLITGSPGCGKTSFLRELGLKVAEGSTRKITTVTLDNHNFVDTPGNRAHYGGVCDLYPSVDLVMFLYAANDSASFEDAYARYLDMVGGFHATQAVFVATKSDLVRRVPTCLVESLFCGPHYEVQKSTVRGVASGIISHYSTSPKRRSCECECGL